MRRVRAPDGRRWRVGRRWLPWHPRKRNIDLPDVDLSGFDDGLIAALLALVAVFVLARRSNGPATRRPTSDETGIRRTRRARAPQADPSRGFPGRRKLRIWRP